MIHYILLSETTSVVSSGILTGAADAAKTFADLISDYGPLIVFVSVFLVIFIITIIYLYTTMHKMIKKAMDSQTDYAELITNQSTKILDTVLKKIEETNNTSPEKNISEEEKVENSYKKKDMVGIYIDVSMAFKDASRVALNKIHCERIAIYVFHNGNHSFCGFPFYKMSCVHEWTIRGYTSYRDKSHADLPLHLYNFIVDHLYNEGEYVVSDVKQQCNIDNTLSSFIDFANTNSLFILGIKDSEGNLVGFTVAEFKFQRDFTDENQYKIVKEALDDMNMSIRTIITDNSFIDSVCTKKLEDDESSSK